MASNDSVFDSETFLPGTITEIQSDYSFGYDTSEWGTTDSVVVIGTAFTGPVGQPTQIYNPEHATFTFGKAYDNASKQEASLVAGIKDAYDKGCRTIYGVRVGGKDIFKDFDLCIDTDIRFRVAGATPSNSCKDLMVVYDATSGDEKLSFYKKAEKATIAEKMQGMVTSDNAILVTELRLNQDYGYTADAKLVDVIRVFNNHPYNNVLKLSLVNADGDEVTNSVEAYSLSLGALFPGIYYIGRDKNQEGCSAFTNVKYVLVDESSTTASKPYPSFTGVYYKELVANTDVSMDIPIFADTNTLRDTLKPVQISMLKLYDFLETAGLSDRAFAKDEVDYEEANLSAFQVYKRLGNGFAISAHAIRRVDGTGKELTPRIKETAMEDSNRIVPLLDGIYSTLENLAAKYRVLICGSADQVISGKLPKAAEFIMTAPEQLEILNGAILATPKIVDGDQHSAKAYSFKFDALPATMTDAYGDIYTDKVMQVIASITDATVLDTIAAESGTEIMLIDPVTGTGTLKRFTADGYETLAGLGLVGESFIVDNNIYVGANVGGAVVFQKDSVTATSGGLATYKSKEYVLGVNNDKVFVFKVIDDPLVVLKPLGDLVTMLSDNPEKTLVYAQSNYVEENPILIQSAYFDSITLEEFVEYLNDHECLSNLFNFEISSSFTDNKDDFITDVASAAIGTAEYKLAADRVQAYDYSLYIPYRTTDNFARQLAQHCTYTELKTCPAHGIIGSARIADMSLNSVAKKVESLVTASYDLYAKNNVGRNLLDKNNLPYPIGRNLSITFMQSMVVMDDDSYQFLSNGCASYAGMVSTLPLDQSSTNQPIAIATPLFSLSNYQLTRLTQAGYVVLKNSYTKGIVICDGVTMAPAESEFRRLAASRITGAVEDLLRAACDPFIGKQNNAANRNSLQTAVKSSLEKIKGTLIESYDFNLVVDRRSIKFSYIDIDYDIVPVGEIRNVRNRINVKEA